MNWVCVQARSHYILHKDGHHNYKTIWPVPEGKTKVHRTICIQDATYPTEIFAHITNISIQENLSQMGGRKKENKLTMEQQNSNHSDKYTYTL